MQNFSILDLSPISEGQTAAQALGQTVALAQVAEAAGGQGSKAQEARWRLNDHSRRSLRPAKIFEFGCGLPAAPGTPAKQSDPRR